MLCTTIRKDDECVFMTAGGCSYNGGACNPIIEQCKGCNRTAEYEAGVFCVSCPDPAKKWKDGGCNLATHFSVVTDTQGKTKLNPIKASKRRNK